MTAKLDEVLEGISHLDMSEKRELLRRLATLPEFIEDLSDLATFYERRDEPSRPYLEFREELKSEGRL